MLILWQSRGFCYQGSKCCFPEGFPELLSYIFPHKVDLTGRTSIAGLGPENAVIQRYLSNDSFNHR